MRFFGDAQVSPVLTAHPTEVRRKSTMDREMEIAALLDRRERMKLTPEEAEASDEQLRRAVLTLWQTNLLRRTKLTVLDEVANGLSFYDYTFLHEVPRLHCALEDLLNQDEGASGELASFLTMGSWIGGDRDGNPFVTADVMRGTLRLQSSRVMNFYLEQLHALGSELSLAAHLADVSDELRELSGRSPDTSPHRSGEPYRLAVSGIYARLTATALRLEVETTRRPVGEAAPYASVKEFKADLDVLDRSLIANNSGVIARGRLRLLRRAVDCFGFHLARLDIRQNSAVHERTVAELFDAAIPGMSYLALGEEARVNLLMNELRSARPLSSAFVKYSEETLGELARVPRRRRGPCQVRRRRDPPMHHLDVQGHVRHAGGGGAAEGGRPRQSVRPQRDQHRAAVRDHRGSAGVIRHHGPDAVAARLPQAGGQPRRRSGSDARLFRQQQGWRLRHLGLGALQGRDRAGRGVRAPPRAAAAVPRPRRIGRPRRRTEL